MATSTGTTEQPIKVVEESEDAEGQSIESTHETEFIKRVPGAFTAEYTPSSNDMAIRHRQVDFESQMTEDDSVRNQTASNPLFAETVRDSDLQKEEEYNPAGTEMVLKSASTTAEKRIERILEDSVNNALEVTAKHEEIKCLSHSNYELREQNIKLGEEKLQLEHELALKTKKIEELVAQVENLKEIRCKLAKAEKLHNKSQQHINTLDSVIQDSEEQVRLLQNERRLTSEKIAALERKCHALEKKLEEKSCELRRATNAIFNNADAMRLRLALGVTIMLFGLIIIHVLLIAAYSWMRKCSK